MTYRDDDRAEEERERAMKRELAGSDASLRTERSLVDRKERTRRALRDVEDQLGRKRAKIPLPLLARVEIASPCEARWDEMQGDARVRHCGLCDKDVYDLSEMTAAEAEALLAREGEAPCVRLHRRADGTVITSDCPVGVKKKRRRRVLAAGAALAGSLVAAVAGAMTTTTQGEPCVIPPSGPVAAMGAVAQAPVPVRAPGNAPLAPVPAPVPAPIVTPTGSSHVHMGGASVSSHPPVRMERIARPR